MSGKEVGQSTTRYEQRKSVNLYREQPLEMWDHVERAIREKYDVSEATQGEIAAQAWAEWLGQSGPLDKGGTKV